MLIKPHYQLRIDSSCVYECEHCHKQSLANAAYVRLGNYYDGEYDTQSIVLCEECNEKADQGTLTSLLIPGTWGDK